MSRQSLQLELAERPREHIVPGQTFRQVVVPAPTADDLKDGELLLETLYLSLDPAMRGWLDDVRSYLPPVGIGEVMRGRAICRVLASKSAKAQAGEVVSAYIGFREVGVLSEQLVESAADLPPDGRITDLIGVLGLTGLTAYFGLAKIGVPQAGETVVVSGAAGATGSVVAQIAKLKGARVIAIAGREDKVRWLKEDLGVDVALNYKDPDFVAKFTEATPDYIDVFWDNVGGEQLDLALARAAKFARFVMCGAISQYNSSDRKGPKACLPWGNIFNVIVQRIRMQGFIVMDYAAEYPAARKELTQWLSGGKIKRRETIIKGGLKAAEEGLLRLFSGENTGKLMVEVKDPEGDSKL